MTNFESIRHFTIAEHSRATVKIGLGVVIAEILTVILVAVFVIATALEWSDLQQATYPTTSTFIGSSDVVKLGCYSTNTLKSVEINKTSSTNVYSSKESSNEALIMTKKLDETEPVMFEGPYKFQVYYGNHYNRPLYSVKSGNIIYNFAVQKTKITDNCTLKIYVFNSYFELSKYLNTAEEVISINETCLTTSKTKDAFMVEFTLPAEQYIYMAGIANNSGVDKMNYSAIGGSVTAYDTSQLNNETQCNNNNEKSCSITFRGHGKKCVFVSQVIENGLGENYNYIQAEFTKVKATPTTISLTVLLVMLCFISVLLIIFCVLYRTNSMERAPLLERQQLSPLNNTQTTLPPTLNPNSEQDGVNSNSNHNSSMANSTQEPTLIMTEQGGPAISSEKVIGRIDVVTSPSTLSKVIDEGKTQVSSSADDRTRFVSSHDSVLKKQ